MPGRHFSSGFFWGSIPTAEVPFFWSYLLRIRSQKSLRGSENALAACSTPAGLKGMCCSSAPEEEMVSGKKWGSLVLAIPGATRVKERMTHDD